MGVRRRSLVIFRLERILAANCHSASSLGISQLGQIGIFQLFGFKFSYGLPVLIRQVLAIEDVCFKVSDQFLGLLQVILAPGLGNQFAGDQGPAQLGCLVFDGNDSCFFWPFIRGQPVVIIP